MSRAEALDALAWLVDAGIDAIVAEEPRSWLNAEESVQPKTSPKRDGLDNASEHVRLARPLGQPANLLVEGAPGSGVALVLGVDPRSGGSLILAETEARLLRRMMDAIAMHCDEVIRIGLPAGAAGESLRESMITHIEPVMLLLGDGPSKALLGMAVGQARGRIHQIDVAGRTASAVATFAPEFLVRQPRMKALAWADLMLFAGVVRTRSSGQ